MPKISDSWTHKKTSRRLLSRRNKIWLVKLQTCQANVDHRKRPSSSVSARGSCRYERPFIFFQQRSNASNDTRSIIVFRCGRSSMPRPSTTSTKLRLYKLDVVVTRRILLRLRRTPPLRPCLLLARNVEARRSLLRVLLRLHPARHLHRQALAEQSRQRANERRNFSA